jgi:hypothetical protein
MKKWIRKAAYRRPGSLFLSFMAAAHERLNMGIPTKMRHLLKVPLMRYLTEKSSLKTPRDVGEGATLLEALQLLLRGQYRILGDLLCGRFKAVEEANLKKGEWASAEALETRTEITGSLSQTTVR